MHFAFHRNSAYELLLIAAVLRLYCVRKFEIHYVITSQNIAVEFAHVQ